MVWSGIRMHEKWFGEPVRSRWRARVEWRLNTQIRFDVVLETGGFVRVVPILRQDVVKRAESLRSDPGMTTLKFESGFLPTTRECAMTRVRIEGESVATPNGAVLMALNNPRLVECEYGDSIVASHLELQRIPLREGEREAWSWRLGDQAPRCVLEGKTRYIIEEDTGAARRAPFSEQWAFRDGVVVLRSDGSYQVAIDTEGGSLKALYDATCRTETGAFQSL